MAASLRSPPPPTPTPSSPPWLSVPLPSPARVPAGAGRGAAQSLRRVGRPPSRPRRRPRVPCPSPLLALLRGALRVRAAGVPSVARRVGCPRPRWAAAPAAPRPPVGRSPLRCGLRARPPLARGGARPRYSPVFARPLGAPPGRPRRGGASFGGWVRLAPPPPPARRRVSAPPSHAPPRAGRCRRIGAGMYGRFWVAVAGCRVPCVSERFEVTAIFCPPIPPP